MSKETLHKYWVYSEYLERNKNNANLELISKTVTWDTLIIIEYDSTQIAVSANAVDLLDKELKERDILEVNIRYSDRFKQLVVVVTL